MTLAGPDFAELCLYQVWQELTVRGFAVDEPVTHGTCQCFFGGLRGAQAEMDLLTSGALVWEYLPIPQGGITAQQAARLVLALLAPGPVPATLPPAPDPDLPLKDAAAQMLAARGMMARPAAIRYPFHCPRPRARSAHRGRGPQPRPPRPRVRADHRRGHHPLAMPARRPRTPRPRAGSPRDRPGHRRRPR